LLDTPGDLLDATPDFLSATADNVNNVRLGGQWQVYFQTVNPGDFGGTGAYMAQNYGNLPFIADTSDSYSNVAWVSELNRLSHDPATGHTFQRGDLIEVRARTGLEYDGEFNVNEAHDVDPLRDFDIVLVQADYGLPTPTRISLSAVRNGSDNDMFDATRATGGEHYQGTLVTLAGVHLLSPAADWQPLNYVTVGDDTGRTFPLLLGSDSGFNAAPVGDFDATGIFSQDGSAYGANGPVELPMTGYRLWVNDPTGIVAVPEPGPAATMLATLAALLATRKRNA